VTRHLRDDVSGLDQSPAMVEIAARVYKRFFTPEGLAAEVGGGRVLHAGRWFVMVASP
jgi:hypothetical protein